MYRSRDVLQQSSDIIDVACWMRDRDSRPERGSRPNQTLISPSESRFQYLVSNHKYLLKFPNPRAPAQYWNEVVAHRLGAHMGIAVPPTHVAVNTLTRQVGSLSEYFHGHNPSRIEKYYSGGEILRSEIRNYDRRKDRRHNFTAIANWCSFLERNKLMLEDWREYWAKAFLLDSLMGNTDRHHDNWGTMWWEDGRGKPSIRFSPLFDNGTSLGYELPEVKLTELFKSIHLAKYVNRGTHQMLWREEDSGRINHPQFLKMFYDEFPAQRAGILSRLRISDRTIVRVIEGLSQFSVPIPLTKTRAAVMFQLLKYRRDNLLYVLRHGAVILPLAA
jgi:hypothetical protein